MLSVRISFHFFCFALRCSEPPDHSRNWAAADGSRRRERKRCKCSLFTFSVPVFRGSNSETFRSQAGCRQLRPIPLAAFPGSALAWINLTRREITWVTLAPVQQALVDTNAADVTRLVHTCPAHIHLHTWLSPLPLYISRLNLRWCAVSKACHRQKRKQSIKPHWAFCVCYSAKDSLLITGIPLVFRWPFCRSEEKSSIIIM